MQGQFYYILLEIFVHYCNGIRKRSWKNDAKQRRATFPSNCKQKYLVID